MAEEMTFKKKVETVKLLLSSLFARKQQYLIVDGNHKNRFMYTNLPYERVVYYRPDIEDTLCGVTINDVVAPLIYEAFPVLGTVIAELKMQDFLSTMNKQLTVVKDKWPELKVDGKAETVVMKLSDAQEDGTSSDSWVVVGKLLPPDAMEYYDKIIANFSDFMKNPVLMDIEVPKAFAADKLFLADIPVPGADQDGDSMFKYPVKDGATVVSFKEYLSKRDKEAPWKFQAQIQYNAAKHAARIASLFRDDWVDCISLMPAAMWFPF